MKTLQITALLIIASFSVLGQNIHDLKIEQPSLNNLFVWNNLVIVEKAADEHGKFFICDTSKEKLERLTIEKDTNILALAESTSFLYAIVKRGDAYVLITKHKNQNTWISEGLFPDFNTIKRWKLVANDNLLILVTMDKIYTKTHSSEWTAVPFNSIVEKTKMFLDNMPSHYVLTKNSFFLAFDNGEWGGSLWEIPISTSRKAVLSKGKLVVGDNIKGLQYASSGVLWIATGLAHLDARESGVYKYANNTLQKVLWSMPSLSLKEPADLSAFCLKNAEQPFFVASALGVFKMLDENLEEVIHANLYLRYSLKNYDVGSSPVAMHVDGNNTIYIAQRSLGVFVYTKTNDSYAFRQLSF